MNHGTTFEEKHAWYWIACNEIIGLKTIGKLIDEYKTARNIYYCKFDSVTKLLSNQKQQDIFLKRPSEDAILNSYAKMQEKGINFVIRSEKHFPEKLKVIKDAPYFFFYKGELPDCDVPSIAIIGARACTVYGANVAKDFAKKLSLAGVNIISGLAVGIDSFAHEGALENQGYNLAVLGNGVDICYPVSNKYLYNEIVAKGGGLLSEYPPQSKAQAYHFPFRNRLISALSDGVLIVEAKKRSGSMITVDYALEQGKDVYCIPGRITDNLSAGCNTLIQAGAKLAECVNDILEDIEMKYPLFKKKELAEDKTAEVLYEMCFEKEKILFRALSECEMCHIDLLLMKTGIEYCEAVNLLFSMEIKGIVRSNGGSYYKINSEFSKKNVEIL